MRNVPNGEEANIRVVGRLGFFRAVARKAERQAHLRLAAAQPHVSNHYVVQLHSLMPGDLDDVRAAHGGRLNFTCQRRSGPATPDACRISNLDLHFVSGLSPSPDGVRLAALQNHVVGKQRADKRKRLDGCRRGLGAAEGVGWACAINEGATSSNNAESM